MGCSSRQLLNCRAAGGSLLSVHISLPRSHNIAILPCLLPFLFACACRAVVPETMSGSNPHTVQNLREWLVGSTAVGVSWHRPFFCGVTCDRFGHQDKRRWSCASSRRWERKYPGRICLCAYGHAAVWFSVPGTQWETLWLRWAECPRPFDQENPVWETIRPVGKTIAISRRCEGDLRPRSRR